MGGLLLSCSLRWTGLPCADCQQGTRLRHHGLMLRLLPVLLLIALSVYAHGLTARPVTDAYARWFAARAEPPAMESTAAHEHRWRRPAAVVAPELRAPTSTGA